MAAKGLCGGIGKVTLASRERQVLMEPRGLGMLMSTLRSAVEVRTAEFAVHDTGGIDPDMLAIAETIITRARGKFDPADFRDTYQDALRGLVDKLKGIATAPRTFAEPAKVIDLMEALKRGLIESGALPAAKRPKQAKIDRTQPQLLMPVQGSAKKPAAAAKETPAPAVAPPARRKKAS